MLRTTAGAFEGRMEWVVPHLRLLCLVNRYLSLASYAARQNNARTRNRERKSCVILVFLALSFLTPVSTLPQSIVSLFK
jgi:hypothetical protein